MNQSTSMRAAEPGDEVGVLLDEEHFVTGLAGREAM